MYLDSKNAFICKTITPEIDSHKLPVMATISRRLITSMTTEQGNENWHVQKEEILLLMSVYCGEGECAVSYEPAHSDFPPKKERLVKMETLCDMHEPAPWNNSGEGKFFNIYVKLQVQTEFEQSIDVQVTFSLPKLYPNIEVPVISISSDHVIQEDLSRLTKRANSLSKALLPQPCLLEILAEIKDDIMGVRLCDPIHGSKRANVQSTLTTNQAVNMDMPCQLFPQGKSRPLK